MLVKLFAVVWGWEDYPKAAVVVRRLSRPESDVVAGGPSETSEVARVGMAADSTYRVDGSPGGSTGRLGGDPIPLGSHRADDIVRSSIGGWSNNRPSAGQKVHATPSSQERESAKHVPNGLVREVWSPESVWGQEKIAGDVERNGGDPTPDNRSATPREAEPRL